jgi:Bacterial membrane protein YfhO
VRSRPTLSAAVILALLALAFVSPALVPGHTLSNSDSFWFKAPWAAQRPADLTRPANPEFDDAPAVLQPFVRYTRRELPDIPLWNPYIMAGRPFLADAQSGIFSPFNLPSYLLDFWTSLAWIAALKLWVAAFGAYLLGRTLGMRFAGALLAGVVYGFNLWLVTWVSYPHASVWALVPWLLVAADRVARRPSPGPAAALAALVGVQFLCGHPESSFHALVATVIFFALRLRVHAVAWRRALAVFAASLAGGAALAALTLVPFAELLLHSADIHQRAGTAGNAKVPLKYSLGIFLPGQWGKPTQTPLEIFLLARAFYGGALALMLAAVALIVRPRGARLVTAVAGAACMLVVFGIPPVFDVVVHLPVFSGGHNTRLAIFYLLCLALLAGWGLDDLLERRGDARRRRLALAAAGAIFVLPLAYTAVRGRTSFDALGDALHVAWGFADPPDIFDPAAGDVIRGAAALIWVGVAGGALALVALAARAPRRTGLLAGAAVALAALDLARAGMGYNPAIERADAVQPMTPAIRMLARASPARFVSTGDIPQDATPMNFGLFEARGYDLPVEERYDHLWRSQLSPEFPSQVGIYPQYIPLSLPRVTPRRLHALSVLGVTHVMQPVSDPPLRVPGLRLVHPGPDARVYANDDAQPRAVVVGAQRVVDSGEDALRAIAAPGFDLRREAVTERALPGLARAGAAGDAPAGTARILPSDPDKLVVDAAADRPGLLVVSDNWAPGWTATVDGHRTSVERVDYVFRGVRVGAGRHRVVFAYRPVSWRIGWIVSLLALAGLVATIAVAWRRAR